MLLRAQDEDLINEGLDADVADARITDASGVAAPVAEVPFPDEVDDSTPDAEDEEGLLTRPPHSTEVFVSGLARTTTEEELRAVAEPHGALFELRLLSDPATGQNRGYAFLVYTRREDAATAVDALNGTELKGRKLRASLSPAKFRLFVGNLPKERFGQANLQRVLRRIVVGVDAVDVPAPDRLGSTASSRGFAFVSFYNTACAEKARRVLSSPTFTLRGRQLTVNWAEKSADETAAANVKSLYVANLPAECKPEALKAVFEQFGDIERVIIPQMRQPPPQPQQQQPAAGDEPPAGPPPPPQQQQAPQRTRFGFVHFAERSSALAALDAAEHGTQTFELEGQTLEVTLAKPEKAGLGGGPPQPGGVMGGGMMHVMPPAVGSAVAVMTQGRGGMGPGGIAPRGGMYGRGGGMPMMAGPPGMMQGGMLAPVMMPNGQMAYVMQPQGAPGGGGYGHQGGGYGGPPRGGRGQYDNRRQGGRGGGGGAYSNDARYRPY